MHAMCILDQHQQGGESCAAIRQRDTGQSMRAQHASNTTARASYHTRLPSFKRLAIALVGYQVGDADDETSRQRGAWDVPTNYV